MSFVKNNKLNRELERAKELDKKRIEEEKRLEREEKERQRKVSVHIICCNQPNNDYAISWRIQLISKEEMKKLVAEANKRREELDEYVRLEQAMLAEAEREIRQQSAKEDIKTFQQRVRAYTILQPVTNQSRLSQFFNFRVSVGLWAHSREAGPAATERRRESRARETTRENSRTN